MRRRRPRARWLLDSVVLLGLMAIWQAVTSVLRVPPYLVPQPMALAMSLSTFYVQLMGDAAAPTMVAIATLISFFPALVNSVRGLRSMAPQSLELLQLLDASRGAVQWRFDYLRRYPQFSLPYA